ncbi:MAG TPA: DUF3857 and transglutaminase domain-containing protein [Candidatus Binatia bacterium]|nr:DUF3857 and transglutaminase domain-containing protein [Candidatus Binatia bacterium]
MVVARPAPRWYRFALGSLIALAAVPCAGSPAWDPIGPQDLKIARAQVDSTADAEALFWKIQVEDAWTGSSLYSDYFQYIRIQVFNERGAAAHNQVAVPYDSKTKILDLQARVVGPNGIVKEIAKSAVFERTLLKAGGRKIKEKSFAVPDLKPGSILEYRWTQRRYDRLANYLQVDLQRGIPVRSLELRMKPLEIPGSDLQFRISSFHGPTPSFDDAPGGFHVAEFRNVEAFHSEPRMPPENAVRHWILLQYRSGIEPPPTEAWKRYAKTACESWGPRLRSDGAVKKAAADAVAGASSEPEKIRRLAAFCRSHVRNIEEDAVGAPPVPDDAKKNDSPGETLKSGAGGSFDIQCLLAAMATTAGLQARIALLPDPDEGAFQPESFTPYFWTESCVAVWVDGAWTFLNPAERYTRECALPARQEGRQALLLDADNPRFLPTPVSPPLDSQGRRRGVFQLGPDGALEGDVTIQYSGHWGEEMKEEADDVSAEQREKNYREQLRSRMSAAEVSALRFDHALDADGPYTVSYHVRVPDYATRVGKRLIFDPAIFETGRTPEFRSAVRRFPVSFPYSWSEDDSIVVRLPAGFSAEGLPQLAPLTFPNLGGYDGLLATSMDGTSLLFRRRFEFGRNGTLDFPASEYPTLKKAFDTIAERDAMAVSLTTASAAEGR